MRTAASPLPLGPSWAAAIRTPCRFQAERPATFSEITESVTVLGIPELSKMSEKDLKSKYRELVKKHHPDAGGSEATMSKITVAYDRISRLSKREREEFDMQRRAFRGGSGAGSSTYSNQFSGFTKHNPQSRYARNPYEASYKYNHDGQAPPAGGPGWAEEGHFSRAYNFRNHQGSGGRSSYAPRGPSNFHTPFSVYNAWDWVTSGFTRPGSDFRQMAPSAIFFRLCMAYVMASIIFSLMYRRYRDWRQEEGWSQAEHLARDEQREELLRVRRELAERIRQARDPMATTARERAKELRALEYAQQRQVELQQQELRGWPAVDPSRGKIVRRAYEPVGIVYYEPVVQISLASGGVPPSMTSMEKVAGPERSGASAYIPNVAAPPPEPSRTAWNRN
jgi:curved DNA-binding protein CbpA